MRYKNWHLPSELLFLPLDSGTYSCTCMPGYFPAETDEHGASKCEDINECESGGINLCPPDAYCSNFNGEFELRTDIKMSLRWL